MQWLQLWKPGLSWSRAGRVADLLNPFWKVSESPHSGLLEVCFAAHAFREAGVDVSNLHCGSLLASPLVIIMVLCSHALPPCLKQLVYHLLSQHGTVLVPNHCFCSLNYVGMASPYVSHLCSLFGNVVTLDQTRRARNKSFLRTSGT